MNMPWHSGVALATKLPQLHFTTSPWSLKNIDFRKINWQFYKAPALMQNFSEIALDEFA